MVRINLIHKFTRHISITDLNNIWYVLNTVIINSTIQTAFCPQRQLSLIKDLQVDLKHISIQPLLRQVTLKMKNIFINLNQLFSDKDDYAQCAGSLEHQYTAHSAGQIVNTSMHQQQTIWPGTASKLKVAQSMARNVFHSTS